MIQRSDSGSIKPSSGTNKLPPYVHFTFQNKQNPKKAQLHEQFFQGCVAANPYLHAKCHLCEQYHLRELMTSVGQCRHRFCVECLQKYCNYKIGVMEEVSCPEQSCPVQLNTEGQFYKQLPEQAKIKYRRLMLWKQTIANPDLRLCPTQNCEGVINSSHKQLRCSSCGVRFCKECQLPYHKGPCDINFQKQFINWKRCPKCRMFVDRVSGCEHITCRCGYQFCYFCLKAWKMGHRCEGYLAQNQRPYFYVDVQPEVEHIPQCLRVILGWLMILALPIVLLILIFAFLIALVVGFVGGLTILPFYMWYYNQQKLNYCHVILGIPIFIVVLPFAGIMIVWYFGLPYLQEKFKWWGVTLKLLLNNHDANEIQQFQQL